MRRGRFSVRLLVLLGGILGLGAGTAHAQLGGINWYNGSTFLGNLKSWKADGTTITCSASGGVVTCSAVATGSVTAVTATLPVTSSGGTAPNVALNIDATLQVSGGNLGLPTLIPATTNTWATGDTLTTDAQGRVTAINNVTRSVLTTGDLQGGGTLAANRTLSLINQGTAGSCGDSSHSCGLTFNARGIETAQANVAISATAIGAVTSVSGTAPIVSSGGQTPTISLNIGTGLTTTANNLVIADTAITPATYGSATQSPQCTYNQQGQATGCINVTIAGVATNSTFATIYANGANGTDETALLTAARGPLILKDAATPIGTLFQMQTNGAANIALFDASNLTFGQAETIQTTTGNLILKAAGVGGTTIQQTVQTTGSPSSFTVTGPAHTTLTIAEQNDVNINLARTVNFAVGGGTVATQRAALIQAPTYTATTNAVTLTTAATVAINNAPTASTNITITNTLAFWTQAGKTWHEIDAVGTSSAASNIATDVINGTAAANNAQQYSPLAGLGRGNGWQTASGGASTAVAWYTQVQPIQGASAPTGQVVFSESIANATPTAYWQFIDTTTMESLQNASWTFQSDVTMSGTAKAFVMNSKNAQTSGDKVLSVQSNTTEIFRVGLEGAVNGASALTVSTNTTLGPFFAILNSGSNGAAGFTTDCTAQTSGRKWTMRGIGNITASGGLAAGDWALLDATGSVNRMIFKSGGTATVGDSTTLSTSTLVLPGATWAVSSFGAKNTTTPIGLSVFNGEISSAGVAVERSSQLELAGHVWNTTAVAADNYAVSAIQMVPTSANSPSTQLNFSAYVGTSNTRTYVLYMTWTDTNTFTASNVAGIKFTQTIQTTGSPNTFTVTGAAHTTLTGAVEASDVVYSLNRIVQFSNGTLTTQRAIKSLAPTYAFSGASTLTTAVHRYLDNAPIVGTNATFTNAYELYLDNSQNIASAGTITQAATLYINGAQTSGGTITTNYAMLVNAGNVGFGGTFSLYNGETTAGTGVPYTEKVGQDVASSGLGAQNTTIATYTPAASGMYIVEVVCSATTTDTVTVAVTYTDAVNTTAQTNSIINGIVIGTNGTVSGEELIRANTSTNIVAKITISAQASTKCGAVILKAN